MRPPERIDPLLELLEEIWLYDPDLRFLQLIYNLQRQFCHEHDPHGIVESEEQDGSRRIGFDLFHTEDEAFGRFLEKRLAALKSR